MCCWEAGVKLVLGWRHKELGVAGRPDPCKQDSLCSWRHVVPYNYHILDFFFICLDSFCENELHHTQHTFLVQFGALCPKPCHLKDCWIEVVVLNSSTLKIMPVFWHTNSPEISDSACFTLSNLILIKGRSLPDLLDFILSDSAWVSLFKSSRILKSSSVTLLDTPLKTKIFLFVASAEW